MFIPFKGGFTNSMMWLRMVIKSSLKIGTFFEYIYCVAKLKVFEICKAGHRAEGNSFCEGNPYTYTFWP